MVYKTTSVKLYPRTLFSTIYEISLYIIQDVTRKFHGQTMTDEQAFIIYSTSRLDKGQVQEEVQRQFGMSSVIRYRRAHIRGKVS